MSLAAQVKPPTAPDKKATAPATSASNVLESPLREWIPIPRQEITAAAPAHGKAGKAGKTGDQTAKIFGSKSNTSNDSSGFERNYSKHAGCSKTNDGRLGSVENLRASKKRSADGGTPTRDVETGALVWCSSSRGNGTKTVVVYEDGLTVTRHADGTVQRWQRNMIDQGGEVQLGIGLVLVECAGFPSVEVSVMSGIRVRDRGRGRRRVGVRVVCEDGSTFWRDADVIVRRWQRETGRRECSLGVRASSCGNAPGFHQLR